ncbi:molybdopterin molybdotransferase MoeA [Geomobilimonas luticola]|uniref:Molybdopterin molybdenumtransferase n=1 Tax=Geomobilimonas luticola TaxID=1114878 RepID=A0ABS5SI56_9BACT|nr:gephyrin-like molybdotransferase Glp [Geomobilimonas luticola]MBT0654497.1 molybdopterin molybdotransferase MoeA [Geomobilimonas luticola]
MTTFAEARSIILDNTVPLGSERVMLGQAVGRLLAEDIIAPWDIPLWDNSAMDGFAVRAADCRPGTTLPVTSFLPAGGSGTIPLAAGSAIRIMTGAPIPPGVDAVIPIEETDPADDRVTLIGPVRKGQHIRYRGEDVTGGEPVIPAGTLIRPAEISMLASCSRLLVPVHRRPRVAIVSTGDELVEPGEPLAPGQIINSNTLALAAAVLEAEADPVIVGIARDDLASHREKLLEGLQADVLITSAGVSAGDRDLVRDVLEELGVKQLFWKVDIKPGRPTAFGVRDGKPVFSLPGNPVASLVTFELFVRPALLRMMGHRRVIKPTVSALLQDEVKKKPGRLHFIRVQVEKGSDGYLIRSSGDQNTGILKTLVHANGLALLPPEGDRFPAGTPLEVILLDRQFEMDKP